MAESNKTGTLFVVGTPIGNLEDITFRAVRILKEADLIACEDTRQSCKLLDHYIITTPTVSYHEHNEAERAAELVEKLVQGQTIAQISDAGMPGISDPGYRLVQMAIERGIRVVPVPGPSAMTTALVTSGLPTDAFEFHGFLPAKSGQRLTMLESFRACERTIVLYEAPHRIREALEDIVKALGPNRPIVIARELTKVHEEFIRGTAAEVVKNLAGRELKGEITLLIGRASEKSVAASEQDIAQRLAAIMREQKLDEKAALKVLAKEMGLSKSELYRELQRSQSRKRGK